MIVKWPTKRSPVTYLLRIYAQGSLAKEPGKSDQTNVQMKRKQLILVDEG